MKVTQQLIADAAGLSVATVSRALAAHPGIPAETRRKVEQVARRLGYKGPKARTRARHVAAIGVLVAGNAGGIAHEVLSGVTEAAGVDGIAVSVHMVSGEDREALVAQIGNWALLAAGGLCGVIAVGAWPKSVLDEMMGAVPTVVIGEGEGQERLLPDHASATSALYDWLWEIGHRKIGLVTARELSVAGAGIVGAFRFAAVRSGVETPPVFASADGKDLRKATMTGVTAWICESDDVAGRIRLLLAESKLNAPLDLSLAAVCTRALGGREFAQVCYPWRGIGALAVARLQARMSATCDLPDSASYVVGEVVGGTAAGPPPGAAV